MTNQLIDTLDSLLPQTQCRACGFSGCRPYAAALSKNKAPINCCPPGGIATVEALATQFNLDPEPYLSDFVERKPQTAIINEEECIGCHKCVPACPVDAIIGAPNLMHTILQLECTGCGLCLNPCPVDCITLQDLPKRQYDPKRAKEKFLARNHRLSKAQAIEAEQLRERRLKAKEEKAEMRQKHQNYIQHLLEKEKLKQKRDQKE